jgi:hypothetical protein
MAQLPESEAFRQSVSDEVRTQFLRSIRSKLAMLAVAIAAIAIVLALDTLKAKFRETREKPYSASAILKNLKDPELTRAAMILAKNGGQYATPDDAFNALLAETTVAVKLAEKQQKSRDAYALRIDAIDDSIREAVTAEPAKDEDAAKKALDRLKARRADLVAARAANLAEAEQDAAVHLASLRRAFDDARVAQRSKAAFSVSSNHRLNDFTKHVVDPEHPLSIIYDVLWYASLVVAVLAFVALLLAPLFRALPVTGANDTFMDQIRGIFARAPRAIGSGAVRVAVMSIGTAAVVSLATTAPSSPLYGSVLAPVQIETHETVKTETMTVVHDKTGETKPDPLIAALRTEVDQLKAGKEAQEQKLAAHDAALLGLEPVPVQIATLAGDAQEQKDQVASTFGSVKSDLGSVKSDIGTVRTAVGEVGVRAEAADVNARAADVKAEAADVKADFAQKKAAEVGAQVEEAGRHIGERAASIEDGVYLPYRVGERPPAVKTMLGFDRYRITSATVIYVRKAGAPEEVVNAVTSMEGETVMTNDALRLDLRRRVCDADENCKNYVAWRGTVLRAARLQ